MGSFFVFVQPFPTQSVSSITEQCLFLKYLTYPKINLKMKQLLLFLYLLLLSADLYGQGKKEPIKKNETTKKKEPKEKEPKLTKAEKKEYKRKADELRKEFKAQYGNDPEKFKQFKKDNAEAKREAAKLDEEANRMKKNEDTQKEQVESLKQMNAEDEVKIKELQEAIKKKQKASGNTASATIPTSGTFYAVHIGEANPEVLNKIIENGTAELRSSQDASGHNFYILGLYADAKAAYTLRQQMMAMGIRKANVVRIKDGKLSL